MKRCPKCQTNKSLGDFGRKASNKDGLQRLCRVCFNDYNIAYSQQWRDENPERVRRYTRRRSSDPEVVAAKAAAAKLRRENNLERLRASDAAAKARQRQRPEFKERERLFPSNQPPANAARQARRAAAMIKATPPWVDLPAIDAIYRECARRTAETGVTHHVDHIYPLRNRLACGLHVPWNLRIIPALDNLKKGNRLPIVDASTRISL